MEFTAHAVLFLSFLVQILDDFHSFLHVNVIKKIHVLNKLKKIKIISRN